MSSALPRPTSNGPGSWHEQEQFPNIKRAHSNSTPSSQIGLPAVQGQNRARNGLGSNGDKAVPVPGATMFGNGGDRKGGIGGAPSMYDMAQMARSPPNASNKSKSA
jgi:hypothetical protein